MTDLVRKLWLLENGQDITEYAVMPGCHFGVGGWDDSVDWGSANNVFSATASSIGQ